MNTYIALFRGINVGGKNILAMKELTKILENAGCEDVPTGVFIDKITMFLSGCSLLSQILKLI